MLWSGFVATKRRMDAVSQMHKRGQQVRLLGLKLPVHISWYYLKRSDGKLEKRLSSVPKLLKAAL